MTLKLSSLPSFLLCLVYSIASMTRSEMHSDLVIYTALKRHNPWLCFKHVRYHWFLQRSWALWPLRCNGLCFTTLWEESRRSSEAGLYATTVCGTNWSSTGFRSVAESFIFISACIIFSHVVAVKFLLTVFAIELCFSLLCSAVHTPISHWS